MEQWKNENEQLEGQLKSSRDRESQLMLQLRQTERALVSAAALGVWPCHIIKQRQYFPLLDYVY